MKAGKTHSSSRNVIIACLCLMVAGISLPASALAQAEACSVEVIATCTGSTDCSGSIGGTIDLKNTGTTVITCQVTSGFGTGGGTGVGTVVERQ